MDTIQIRGARTHNLKNIDLDLPRERLIVIHGAEYVTRDRADDRLVGRSWGCPAVRPEISGRIVDVLVRSGQSIEKGQPLVRLDATESRERLRQAEANLQRTRIVAPYAGRVLEKKVDVGQYVSPGTVAATVYAVDYAEIRLPLTDKQQGFVDLPEAFADGDTASSRAARLCAPHQNRNWARARTTIAPRNTSRMRRRFSAMMMKGTIRPIASSITGR